MNNLVYFLIGRFSSLFGNGLLKIVLPIYILEKTSSGSTLGLFIALTALPSLILTPILGNYLENINKKYVMISMDILQFFLFLGMFILKSLDLKVLGIFLVFSIIIERIFDITSSSIFSQIIEEKYIESGNSFKSIFDNIANITSPVVGTFLYYKLGIHGIFIINAITFILSAISECFIKYDFVIVHRIKQSIIKNLFEVSDFIFKDKNLNKLFIAVMLLNFIIAPLSSVILPYLLLNVHNLSNYQFGIINSVYMIGSVIGASLIIFKKKKLKLTNLLNLNSFLFILIGGLSYFLLGKKEKVFLIVICIEMVIGIVVSLINIPLISNFQKMVPSKMQSRFFSLLSFIGGLLIPLGEFGLGRLSDLLNVHLILVLAGLVMILMTYFLLIRPRVIDGQSNLNSNEYYLF